MGEYVQDYRSEDGSVELSHLDGVKWWKAPIPSRFHQCRPQTQGWVNFEFIERCACGGLRLDQESHWMGKNSRRKTKGR